MLKRLWFALVVSLLSVGLVNVAMATVLNVGIGNPIDSEAGQFGIHFKKLIEERTNGKVKVELFPNCSLGDEMEMLQNVRRGTLDVAIVGLGNAVPFVPALGVYTLPYIFDTQDKVVKATTGEMFDFYNNRAIKDGGLRILGHCYSGYRHLTTGTKAVTSLADVKGMKLRVPNNQIDVASYRAWDANPVPMAWAETFTALQQRVVDGQDNPYIVNQTMRFGEVQAHLTELHRQYALQPMFIGEKHFQKRDPEMQKLLLQAGMDTQEYILTWLNENESVARGKMEAEGVTVHQLTDEAEWKRLAIEKVWPKFYDFVGGKKNIDIMLESFEK